MKVVISYFVFFVVNVIVLTLANILFPNQVVLGTWGISRNWAIIHSMGTVAMISAFALPVIREQIKKKKKKLSGKEWIGVSCLVNVVGFWLVARGASQLGMGIRSWRVAVVLGLAVTMVQTVAMTQLRMKKVLRG